MHKYEVGINIQMEGPDNKWYVRYVQVGIEMDGLCTGKVIDYTGAGVFADFNFLDGKEMPGDNEEDRDEALMQIEMAYPGLLAAIDHMLDKYIDFIEGGWMPISTIELQEALERTGRDLLFSDGVDLKPITASTGLTIFPDSSMFKRVDLSSEGVRGLPCRGCQTGQKLAPAGQGV